MRKIAPIKFKFVYARDTDSQDRLRRVYSKIFALARANIAKRKQKLKMHIDSQSTLKYS